MPRATPYVVGVLSCTAVCAASWASDIPKMNTQSREAYIRAVISEKLTGPYTDVGVVVGMIDGNDKHIVYQGYADPSKRHAVSPETLFEIGDLTKVFTGLLLSDMAKRGEVKFDDPVGKYLPEGVAFTSGQERTTKLIDLATSAAGTYWNLPRVAIFHRDALVADMTWQLEGITPTDSTVIGNRPYLFSDLGFGILGHALAKRHKSSYKQILADRLLRPLALENTSIGPGDAPLERIAQGHDVNMNATPSHLHLTMFAGSDGLSSTGADMMKFLEAVLQHQFTRIAFAVRKSISVRRATMRPEQLSAAGWAIFQRGGRDLLWRGSDVDGFSAWMGVDYAAKTAVVVLANVGTPVASEIGFSLLSPSTPAYDSWAPVSIRRDRLEAMVGAYRLNNGDILTIAHSGDHLTLSLAGHASKPAYPTSDRRFVSPDADMTFTFDYEQEEDRHPKRVVFYQEKRIEVADRLDQQPSR